MGTEVGARAPALDGRTHTGEEFSLAGERGSPVVLVFYRGAYCGLCRERLARLQEALPAYRARGVRVVALTPDPPETSRELAGSLGLGFPLVAVDSAALARWGVLAADGAPPHPATFVLDRRGGVLYRHLGRNAADRATDAGLLAVLERASAE